MPGKEPTSDQCDRAAHQAVKTAREELELWGITWKLLASKLKEELEAKTTQHIKFKGTTLGKIKKKVFLKGSELMPDGPQGANVRVLAHGGETVIAWDEVAWEIRQKARQDAHTLRGDYPPEKKEIGGFGGTAIPLKVEVEFVKPEDSRLRR